jgi:hypothetical protein
VIVHWIFSSSYITWIFFYFCNFLKLSASIMGFQFKASNFLVNWTKTKSLAYYYSVFYRFKQFFRWAKKHFFQKPFWWSQKYFAYMSIIMKQTYRQNLRVESAIVLALFKLLNSPISIFMSQVLSSFILSWVCYKICLNEWYKKA